MRSKKENLLNLKMELSTTVNGKETSDKALEFKYGPTEPNIKDNGLTIRLKEKVNLLMWMVIFMMGNGNKIKLLDMASTFIIMEQDIKVIGLMIINMGMEYRHGSMVANMRETTNKERKMEKVNTLGKMEAFIRETGLIIKSPDMVNMSGQMEELILETGSIIKCMEKVFTRGKMEESMKASISLIRNMDSAHILGKTVEDMSENGKTVNVTAEEK